MESKRGVAWSFMIMLVIGVILFVLITSWAGNLFMLSDDALDNFNKLIGNIKEIGNLDGESLNTVTLQLDKDTAIFSFRKDADHIEYYDNGRLRARAQRLPKCESGKPCICLCRKGLSVDNQGSLFEISCENYGCYSLNQETDFKGKPVDFMAQNNVAENKYWINGFIISRSESLSFIVDNTNLPRFSEVQIHKIGDGITVYLVSQHEPPEPLLA